MTIYVYGKEEYEFSEDDEDGYYTLASDLVCDYSDEFKKDFEEWLNSRYSTPAELYRFLDGWREDDGEWGEDPLYWLWDEFVEDYSSWNADEIIGSHIGEIEVKESEEEGEEE